MTPKKLEDPSQHFIQMMMSLYFTDKVGPYSGNNAAETLPPTEGFVLGTMCLDGIYNSQALSNRLFRPRTFDSRECDIFAEVGILGLVHLGYLRPASKAAAQALDSRNGEIWGLGNVPFVVTAKGAKRIGYLVANLRGEDYKEVVKRLQAESKEAAKGWRPH